MKLAELVRGKKKRTKLKQELDAEKRKNQPDNEKKITTMTDGEGPSAPTARL